MHDAILTVCLSVGAGTLLVIAGHKLRVPSIVLLLAGGFLLGPEVLNWVQPATLGRGMETLVAVLVAIILFEGGITLDVQGFRRAPTAIRRLLTVGPLVTWLGTGVAVYSLFGVSLGMALIAGSLVIVTGPTVVSPLLRRLNIDERLHHILYWEAVLIDAVGVFIAVLCFEWMTPIKEYPVVQPLARFAFRVFAGVGVGVLAGISMTYVLKRRYIAHEYVNIFVLACALLTFGVAHAVLSESGILAVVVAGLIVAIRRPRQLARVQQFKLQLTELCIGTLFVLLAAKLDLARFGDPRILLVLAVVIMILRPLTILLATTGQGFGLREQALLSWIAPRGIVAASMASLFSLRLHDMGYENASLPETLTYAVIGATVTMQGLSAPLVARALRLTRPTRRSWLLAGQPRVIEPLANALQRAGARAIPLTAIGNAIDELSIDDPRYADARGLLALHENPTDNLRLLHRMQDVLPRDRAFLWNTGESSSSESGVFVLKQVTSTIWGTLGSPESLALELESRSVCIDVIEAGGDDAVERFGVGVKPLFFVQDGVAELVENPDDPSFARGDLVVALRRRIAGLSQLIADVSVVDHPEPSFERVVRALIRRVHIVRPDMDEQAMFEGIITREKSMSTALGGGVAIPHAYMEGITESRCFVAGVPAGILMETPDRQPIRLVFLIVSPQGQARKHLQALAAVAELAQDASLIEQLSRQRVPERLRRFIAERA